MLISVVIVNYRVKYFLEQTLLSVREALDGLDGEIIVIDNASGDDSMSFIKNRFSEAIYIENDENVGFARANNQGIMMAKGEYILILNPDTIIGHDTIRQSVAWMKAHDDCGGMGIRMLDGNGVFLPESKRSFTTPWVSFCKIFGLSALFPYSPTFAKYHLRYLSETEPHCIDILAGAYMLVKGDLLKSIGGFDNDFFMYGEDIDLSYRIVKAGYKNYYVPIPMIHYKGESTKKESMRYVRVFYEAMLIFFKKHYPHYSRFFAFFIKMAVVARAAMAMVRRIIVNPMHSLLKRDNNADSKQWLIMSDDTEEICNVTNIHNTTESEATATDVLIDNRCHSYQEIINIIANGVSDGTRFHIYSGENKIIISPKMTL